AVATRRVGRLPAVATKRLPAVAPGRVGRLTTVATGRVGRLATVATGRVGRPAGTTGRRWGRGRLVAHGAQPSPNSPCPREPPAGRRRRACRPVARNTAGARETPPAG